MVRTLFLMLLLIGFTSLPVVPVAAEEAPLFASDAPLDVTLTGPMRSLLRASDATEFDFALTVTGVKVPVKLRQRGNFRREQCNVPPIRLNFRKSDTGTPFAGQDKLKLVNPCTTGDTDEQNLLDEYALYRIANLVMPQASFRVRLLRVTWEDTEGRIRWGTRHAFVIEDVDALAARLGGRHVEPERVYKHELEPHHSVRVALFNYLIGNTDFSMLAGSNGGPCCHNGKAIRLGEGDGQTLVVPYDFDMAGAVDARYALPSEKLPIRSVRQRLYRGFCVPEDVLAAALQDFLALREPILGVFRSTPGMTERSVRRNERYAESFFDEIARPDAVRRFMKACR